MTQKSRGSLEELAAQYLDPTISVMESIDLLEVMATNFGNYKTQKALKNMREIMKMIGAKT